MSELTLSQACAETKKFGRMLKGLERLAEVATALESADQAVRDRRGEEARIQERIALATAELAALQPQIEAARDTAKSIGQTASEQAAAALANARVEANRIIAAARTEESNARSASSEMIARAAAEEARLAELQKAAQEADTRLTQVKEAALKAFGA